MPRRVYPLKSLCIDVVVEATVSYQQRSIPLKKLFTAVRELWQELWGLPQVHDQAVTLLHAHVLHPYQTATHPVTKSKSLVEVIDMCPPIITLLAARVKELCFGLGMLQLTKSAPLSEVAECGIFTETNHLQRIGAIHVNLDGPFLERLLPCCQNLTVLTLGCNATSSILYAAKECPLQVLHVNERKPSSPVMSQEVLSELVLGVKTNDLRSVLDSYVVKGEEVTFNPSWPNLTNLSMQWCAVSLEFLALVLIVHRRMEYLESHVVPVSTVVKLYSIMMQMVPSLPKLALKTKPVMNDGLGEA